MARRTRRVAVFTVTGVIVVGAAGTAYAAMSSPAPAYRLATATAADVTASLQAVGTVTPAHQAAVAFPVTGSVASVAVTTGQHVKAGQKLGSVETASLKAKLTAAKSTLASAEAKVASDIASQDAVSSSSSTPQPSSSVAQLQKAVLAAQRKVDGALRQAKAALARAKQACAPGPTPTPAPSPSPSASAGAQQASPPPPSSCAEAQQHVLDAETAVFKAQQSLSMDLAKLDKALSASAAGGGKSANGGSSGSGAGSAGSAVTAAQLAADQASADAATAGVASARQSLRAAKAVSPISGTVINVDVTVGSQASAGSTAFVIAGLGSFQVVADVAVAELPQIKVGQKASVLVDGTSAPLSGSVVAIGLVPSTSGSSVTYPVTIGLTGRTSGLKAGVNASVTVTEAHARGVSVPTSAVRSFGRFATVTVFAGGKTRVTRVTIGTQGPVLTQVTSGLKAGQRVVLADLNLPLPSNSLFGRFGGGAGFAGGGAAFRRAGRTVGGGG